MVKVILYYAVVVAIVCFACCGGDRKKWEAVVFSFAAVSALYFVNRYLGAYAEMAFDFVVADPPVPVFAILCFFFIISLVLNGTKFGEKSNIPEAMLTIVIMCLYLYVAILLFLTVGFIPYMVTH